MMRTTCSNVRSAVILFVCCAGIACRNDQVEGSRNVISERRDIPSFHSVSLRGFGDIEIAPGSTNRLEVEAEDNLLPLIRSEVSPQGELQLGFEPGSNVRPRRPVIYRVGVRTLESVSLAGSGRIQSLVPLKLVELKITTAGSVDVSLFSLDAGSLTCDLTGTGTIKAAGSVDRLTLLLGGTATVNMKALKANVVDITSLGVNDVSLWATKELNAKGNGTIRYKGTAKVTGDDIISIVHQQ